MGVELPLKSIDKHKTLCEVGEVGVVQQVGKVTLKSRDEADEERGE